MAGTLVANTINTDTGLFSTNNAYSGIAKAWVYYNGNTQTITNSFNVSSVTYTSTGIYQVNFATAMPNANYITLASTNSGSNLYVRNDTGQTTTYTGMSFFTGSSFTNISTASLAVFGN
jgi:hypothetical protein